MVVCVKLAVLGMIISFLYLHIVEEAVVIGAFGGHLKAIYHRHSLLTLLFPLLLTPINWSLEGWKWKILASKVETISFQKAMAGVLSGLGLGLISPQGLGDYAGRIGNLHHRKRYRAVGSVFLGSFSQLCVTMVLGCFGLYYFLMRVDVNFSLPIATLVVVALLVLATGLRYLPPKLSQNIQQYSVRYFGIVRQYDAKTLFAVFSLSLARYIIFSIQFVYVLYLMEINLPLDDLLAGVTYIFAAKTIIPTFNFLGDLGVREFSALVFFKQYGLESYKLILGSFIVWCINILLPTFIGCYYILKMKHASAPSSFRRRQREVVLKS